MTEDLRPGVLFDVDGTLCDTNHLHALAWSRALRAAGEWAPMNAIHRLVGMGGDQLLPQLLGHDSPDALARRPARYRELTPDVLAFPRAAEALRGVHGRGLLVVLATSAPDDELVTLRKALDADDVIDGQTSADDVERSKPDPEVFVKAARAAGIGCVAVESGGFSQHELSEAGSRQVYHDVGELIDQFHTGPLAQLCS